MRGTNTLSFVLFLISIIVLPEHSSSQSLSSRLRGTSSKSDIITCLYLKGTQVSIDEYNNNEYNRVDHRCKTFAEYEEDGQSEMVYDLPNPVLSKLNNVSELKSGVSIITIIGAQIHRIPSNHSDIDSLIVINDDVIVTVDNNNSRHRSLTLLRRKGVASAVAVRVVSRDTDNTLVASDLSDRLFGMDRISVASQYYKCSNGQFKFEAAQFQDPITNQNLINGGVVELYYDEDLRGKDMTYSVENDLLTIFQNKYGSADNYDYILFCMPSGMSPNWIGYTYGTTYRSYYNDQWCGYYTLPFHELGHNMGLQHSNENNKEYADRSCMMGKSYKKKTAPEQCFNGVKFAQLNWFPNHTLKINPSTETWTGRLAAFVDVSKLDDNGIIPIILQVGDTFLVFNRGKDYNKGVVGKRDFVTITRGSGTTCENCFSEMLGGIHDINIPTITLGINFDTSLSVRVTFEACQRYTENDIDFMFLSIRREGEPSTCNNTLPPTKQPTQPTQSPTQPPTRSPTRPPTRIPTRPPTRSPTRPPTRSPTRLPTPTPTKLPTPTPTKLPTPNPATFQIIEETLTVLPVSEMQSHHQVTPYVCDDSDTEEFYVPSIKQNQRCVWLQARLEYKDEVCGTNLGKLFCPETCGVCSDNCKDTSSKFSIKNHIRGCEWIKLRPAVKPEVCTEGSDAALYCPETCDICDELRIPTVPLISDPSSPPLIPSPPPTSISGGVCDDDPSVEFYVPEIEKYQRCIWLAARPFYQIDFCDPNHPSNAYSICEETCKGCTDTCEDGTEKFMVENSARDCLWLSLRPAEQKHLCKPGKDAWEVCPETCNVCDYSPSVPSLSPIESPDILFCDDSKSGTFYVKDIKKHEKCVWLSARPERKATLCAEDSDSGARNICPETCEVCADNCEDTNERINVQGKTRDCLWLSLRPDIHESECKKSVIRSACPETCDSCDSLN